MATSLQPRLTQPAMRDVYFHDQVPRNDLTTDATDTAATAEFEATAICIEKCHED